MAEKSRSTQTEISSETKVRIFPQQGQVYVWPSSEEDRVKLILFLESEGFFCIEDDVYSRQGTLESRLPLVIDMRDKSISHMGHVTCAAAAASSGWLIREAEFYERYSG